MEIKCENLTELFPIQNFGLLKDKGSALDIFFSDLSLEEEEKKERKEEKMNI